MKKRVIKKREILPNIFFWLLRRRLISLLGIGKPSQISRCHKGYEEQYRALNKAVAERHYRRRGIRRVLTMAAFIAACLVFSFGCAERRDYGEQIIDRPVVNVPLVMRESNYYSTGSCVHATLITLLRWQGEEGLARDWRQRFRGGEFSSSTAKKLDSRGIQYTYTTKGDVRFLEWACRTRRGCGITVKGGAHMVTLVHLDDEWAAVLDNNDTSKFVWIPRKKLIAEWKRSYGWAVTPVYSPMAPLPH